MQKAYSLITMQHSNSILFIAVLCLACTSQVNANDVHKWVDENGVTHYSDEAPENIVNEVEQITLPATYSRAVGVQDDYYSIANQWMRVHEQRIALEKIKLEKAKQKAALRPVEPPVIVVNETNRRGIFLPQKRFFGRPAYNRDYYNYKANNKDFRRSSNGKHFNRYGQQGVKGAGVKSPERHAFKTR